MVVKIFKWFALSILWWGTSFTAINPHQILPNPDFPGIPSAKVVYHPFYISVTEINQNPKEKTLEISCKLFAEDFETTLNKEYKTTVKLSYIGYEKDKESAYCYFQAEGISNCKKIDIVNSLLHDFNDGQINIVHVVVNGRRQSTKLDYPATRASFVF